MFFCFFVFLASTRNCHYICYVCLLLCFFTVVTSFIFVTYSLFPSIVIYHVLSHFFIRPLGENSKHWVQVAWFTPTHPLSVYTVYSKYSLLCRFCSVKSNLLFLSVFKLFLVTIISVDVWICFSFGPFNCNGKETREVGITCRCCYSNIMPDNILKIDGCKE